MSDSSEVGIYNLALNAIGARNNVTSPDERSREAEVCKLWYGTVRDQVLSGAPWPEATMIDYIPLASEAKEIWEVGDPRDGYRYAYGLPVDCLRPQYLTRFERFQITAGPNNSKLLHTNVERARLVYTSRSIAIGSWGGELKMAIIHALAANICLPLSGKPARANSLIERANSIILSARETAANTSDDVYDYIPETLAARGFEQSARSSFYFPFGSLLTVG